ncbi:MAG: PIN domain-containing protein [Actinomycetota bacterium]|nr:PIN domain-containing protein [Actinomycetota bacterium]
MWLSGWPKAESVLLFAPWPSAVLDSEGLWAVARNEESARVVLASSRAAGVPVLVPVAVLAESLYGDERDARLNQVVKRLQITDVTESLARSAAELKRLAGMTGGPATIDAIVVAVSVAAGGGVILTSDVGDINHLAECCSVRVRAVRV